MTNIGFKQSLEYHTFFIKHLETRRIIVILINVDDIITGGNDTKEQRTQTMSNRRIQIKKLDKLK